MPENSTTLFRYASRFFSGTFLSRLSGLLREVLLAFAFGTQAALAAFMIAYRFAHLFRRLLGEGALQNAFIPHFEKKSSNDPDEGKRFYQALKLTLGLLLLGIVLVGECILGIFLYWGLSPGNEEVIWLTMLMLPSLIFICLSGLEGALLQYNGAYFRSGVAPVFFNLIWIGAILLCQDLPMNQAMAGLACGVFLACLTQWLLCRHSGPASTRVVLSTLKKYSREMRALTLSLGLGAIGIGAAQLNSALDAIFARYADSEGPAFLWFAIRIQQLPLALVGISLANALLPSLSRAVKSTDYETVNKMVGFGIQQLFLFMIPTTAFLLISGGECLNLLYGRGDFDAHSTWGTLQALWGYSLGLIPMSLVLILAPVYYAHHNYVTPTKGVLLAVTTNIFLNALAIFGFGWGAYSIALATSLSSLANAIYLGIKMNISLKPFFMNRDMGIMIFSTGIAALTMLGCEVYFFGGNALTSWVKTGEAKFTWGFADQLIATSRAGLIFWGVYLVGVWRNPQRAYALRG